MKGQKKIPERMCLGCRAVHPKKDMIRVVRSPENVYSVDMTGKNPGRGAYICRNEECFRRAEKEHGFERAFKSKMEDAIYETLRKEIFQDEAASKES